MAGRLVREAGAKVLLLEAGSSDRSPLISMPAGSFKILFGNSPYIKRYTSLPQPSLGGRRVEIAQGNVIGGGSSVNALAYTRGSRLAYDAWDEYLGGLGWGWDDLLPYFVRQERNSRLGGWAHGRNGPLAVSDPFYRCRAADLFVESMQALGVPHTSDFNAGDQRGVGYLQLTAGNARRCSAADAFLKPVRSDKRLTLVTGATATRLLMHGTRAVGVEYVARGQVHRACCDGEVILTAGAYCSPKLLMLSGIGPAAELARHGIEVLVDLPGVGQNMQDHNMVPLTAYTNGAYGYFGHERGVRAAWNLLQYLLLSSGPIASNGAEAVAFVNVDDPEGEPNLQIYNIGTMWLEEGQGKPDHGLTLLANLIRPRSRGWMRLASADPLADPEFSPNYLEHPEDLALMTGAIHYLRRILATAPLSRAIRSELLPGPSVNSDEEIAAYCRAATITNYHPVGSCRMGPASDTMAVLDAWLRVRGTECLRVCDASMMPLIPSANTNAPVMAVADRAVDLMLGRASLRAERLARAASR
ncbi:GMC family oxidoreductase [Rhizorhabdus dicambivorans]|uniref:GMC family oxidoreductase n=1 Tax=Rhizorhabdus dicambivorans TaxID=1850238 RepID=UPI001EDF6E7B|nr:GMC oxidoreductase [Rhizorhabdus dicambivorans]